EPDEHEILGALDREFDTLDAPGLGRIVRGSTAGTDHLAGLEIDPKSVPVTPAPAVVHAKQRGGRGVDETQDHRLVDRHVGFLGPEGGRVEGELERRFHVEPSAPAILLVAGDPLPSPEPYIGHLEERDQLAVLTVEPGLTHRAEIHRVVAE